MQPMQPIFIPFTKVDEDQRIVEGYASTPTLDLQGEKVSLDAIKTALPDYQQWNNLRYMHQPHVIGTAEHTEVDNKGLFLRGKIGDDEAWKAVKDGRLKGFSIGGERTAKVGDTITGLKLYEISLVDRPANPDCKIDLFRAAGLPPGDKGITPSAAARPTEKGAEASEPTFTRGEVGAFWRFMQKLGIVKAADGFSLPASQLEPDPLADERQRNNRPLESGGDRGGDTSISPPGRADRGGPGAVETDDLKDLMNEEKVEFSDEERQHLASRGMAMEDGSYPIRNRADLKRAIRAYGRASDKKKTKAWITRRAKELKATELLPEDWEGSTQSDKIAAAYGAQVLLAKQMDCCYWGSSTTHQMAALYDALISLSRSLRYEADAENGDRNDDKWASKVSQLAQALGGLLAEKAGHEVQEEKEREAARKALLSAGVTQESISMTKSIFDGAGAGAGGGAGDPSEIAKRVSAAHKAALGKAAHHLGEARKCFGKAVQALGKVHKAAQAIHGMGKAADGDSLPTHAKELVEHLARAHEHMAALDDHHDMIEHHLGKAAEGWVGERGQAPGDAEPGFEPWGGLTPHPQSSMTEGDVPGYDPTAAYPGKGAGLQRYIQEQVAAALAPVNKKLGDAEEALRKANEDKARAEGRAEAFAALPAGAPRPRLFAVDKGALGGATPSAPSEREIEMEGVDTQAIETAHQIALQGTDERQNVAVKGANDAALKATARLMGNRIVGQLTGRGNFAKSVLDPAYRGGAG